MQDNPVYSRRSDDKVQISLDLDSEIVNEIKHLTNDPSKVVESAVRQWLRGERYREEELTRILERNPPLPPGGEWND